MPGSYDNLKYKGGDAAEMDAQMMYAKIQSLEKKVQNHEKDKAEQLEDLMHHDFVDHDDHRIHYQSEGYIEVER